MSTDRQRITWRRACLLGVSIAALTLTGAKAQDDPSPLPDPQTQQPLPVQATQTIGDTAQPYIVSGLSDQDSDTLEAALQAAKRHQFAQADSLGASLSNPVARKIVTWTILNNDGNIYSFAQLDAARRDLWGWPREAKRQTAAEQMIYQSGMGPQQIVDWFAGSPPQTIDGATALINAYASLGRNDDASQLAKTWWRTEVFDSGAQANFYQAFSRYLTADDHKARINCLELNAQNGSSQAIRDMMSYVGGADATIATAVIAMRGGGVGADSAYTAALAADPHSPVLAFARTRYLAGKGLEPLGFPLLADLPPASMSPDAAGQLYTLRLDYFKAALKAHDYHAAYDAMNGGGFDNGESKAEAEFFAGWAALVKLGNNNDAISHFQNLATAGTSPITQGRANYWLGRAYEARNDASQNDAATAQGYYAKGGQYIYAFYGQLAAEKAGVKQIVLGHDPVPSAADRARFENRDLVKAARILGGLGETDLFRAIVLNLDTVLPNAEEEALLVDLTTKYDSQVIAMKVARMSMQRGFYLPERAYPLRDIPDVPAPEKAFVLAITRQESGFDPSVRSRANARGMMQLIPSTARVVAKRLGMPWNEASLYNADYNMSLGAHHLGELVDHFDGSYIMAAAGYNAGPSRMGLWVSNCGDPRGDKADALSFIECMPLRETRDYMMRVTENMRIYRARLNGGTAPLTAMADVTRGMAAPISAADVDDLGDGSDDGSVNDQPINYLDYQKAQAVADKASVDMPPSAPIESQPARDKPSAHDKKAHDSARKTSGKKAPSKKTSSGKTSSKKKRR